MDWLCFWEFTPTESEFKAAIDAAEPRTWRAWVRPALCLVLCVLCAVDYFTGKRDNPMMLGLAVLALVVGIVAAVLPLYLRDRDAKENARPDRVVRLYLFEGRVAFDHPADQRPVETLRLIDGGEVYTVLLARRRDLRGSPRSARQAVACLGGGRRLDSAHRVGMGDRSERRVLRKAVAASGVLCHLRVDLVGALRCEQPRRP